MQAPRGEVDPGNWTVSVLVFKPFVSTARSMATTRSSWSSTYPDTVTMQLSNGVRNWRWTGRTN